MKASYSASESGSVASSFRARIAQAQRRLNVAAGLLLAENVGDVVGAEGAGGMSLRQRGGHSVRAVLANQCEQFADLPRQGAIGVGQSRR